MDGLISTEFPIYVEKVIHLPDGGSMLMRVPQTLDRNDYITTQSTAAPSYHDEYISPILIQDAVAQLRTMMSQQTSIPSQYTNYYDYEGLLEMGSGQAFSSDLQPDKNYFFVDQTPYEGPWGEPMDLDEPEQMTLNIEILEGNRVSSERHMKPTASYGGGNKKIRKRKDKSGRKGKPVRVISNQQGSNSRTAGGKELVFEDQEIGFEMDQDMVDPRGTCAYELGVIPQVTGNGVFDGNTLHPEDIYHMGMKEVPAGPFDMRGTRVRWLFGPIDYKGRVARTVREEHHGSSSRKRTHIGTKLPLFELNIV